MARILYDRKAISAAGATNAASGYPASNVLEPAIRRPWRSTGSADGIQVWLDQGSALIPGYLFVQQHNAVNFGFRGGNITPPTTVVGSIVDPRKEPNGRVKNVQQFTASVRYVGFRCAGISTIDDASAWEVGALHLFQWALTIPAPLYPATIRRVRPRYQAELPNGQLADADAGPAYSVIDLRFRPTLADADAVGQIERIANAGICVLDLEHPARPDWVWPVRIQMTEVVEEVDRVMTTAIALTCREVV